MSDNDSRATTAPLHEIFPNDWVQDRSVASAWVRFYSILHIPRAKFFDSLKEFLGSGEDRLVSPGDRLLIGFATMDGFTVPRASPLMFSDRAGRVRVNIKVEHRELPDTNYVLLAMLKSDVGVERSEQEVVARLDAIAALYCLHCGRSTMWEMMWEGEVSLADGKLHTPGDPWRNPLPADGPFLAHQNAANVRELAQKIGSLHEPVRSRIRLALQLMDHGIRAHHGFFEYWTALEVLVGTTNAIKYALSDAYGAKDIAQFSADIGLTELGKLRHSFFHDGKRPHLTADIERYIQLLFLDLLRRELKLEPQGHLAALVEAPGFNLSPLGLPDRRTDEQKAAMSLRAGDAKQGAADDS